MFGNWCISKLYSVPLIKHLNRKVLLKYLEKNHQGHNTAEWTSLHKLLSLSWNPNFKIGLIGKSSQDWLNINLMYNSTANLNSQKPSYRHGLLTGSLHTHCCTDYLKGVISEQLKLFCRLKYHISPPEHEECKHQV